MLSSNAENDVIAQVSSPSGESLGLIEKLRDGAWVAEPFNVRGLTFEMKDDAALYVVRAGTRALRVYLHENEYKDVRIVHDMDWFLEPVSRGCNGWETTLVFWDECPLEIGDQLDAALLPFDDESKSVLRIEAQVHSRTERSCVIRGSWAVDLRRDTDYRTEP